MQRILIIEDEMALREAYNDFFIECGYQTLLASNGDEGFTKLQKHRPAVVLLDICMSNSNGFDFLHQITRVKDPTPIIVMSSKSGIKDSPEIQFCSQVKRVLLKPLNLADICGVIQDLLVNAPAAEKSSSLQKQLTHDEQSLIGSFFVDCQIEKLLGRGTSGLVYKGQHQTLGIPVAIKILDPKYDRSSKEKERFLREVKVLAQLEHPNLIQILNAGIHENLYYMVMRYVTGTTLDHYLEKNGKFTVIKAVEIIEQCALGLQLAHDKGLIHRDLKPSNILIRNENNRVVVIDFGLARDHKVQEEITQKNTVLGTPYYMAPEQCLGLPLSFQSDIYGLGATFYHLVVGQVPFPGKNMLATMMAHTSKPLTPPHVADSSISIELSQIIEKMMKKTPNQRYASMGEVISALEKFKERTLPPGSKRANSG